MEQTSDSEADETYTSNEDTKRKRVKDSPEEAFKRSRKTSRTPTKTNSRVGNMEEEVKELKNEMKGVNKVMQALLTEIQGMRQDHKKYQEEMEKLREENENIKTELGWLRRRVEQLEEVENRMEQIERTSRKNNIIITGLKIESDNKNEIKKEIETFIKNELQIETQINKSYQINRNMYVAEIHKFEDKMSILQNKGKLKKSQYKYIYINSDLTKKERQIQKIIRERAEQEKQLNRNVRVGYKKITINGITWIWNTKSRQLEALPITHKIPKN